MNAVNRFGFSEKADRLGSDYKLHGSLCSKGLSALGFKVVGGAIAALAFMVLGAYLAAGPLNGFMPFGGSSDQVESRTTEIVESVTREQQVVLLSLGLEGTEERTTKNEQFYGLFEVPGSSRSKFVKYEFTAKLGIEGSAVAIKDLGDKTFKVTLPKFEFLGHDDIVLSLASEKNGALSWVTPELDELEIATEILGDDSRAKYLEDYESVLQDQAAVYYGQLVKGIDPDVKLEFEYAK